MIIFFKNSARRPSRWTWSAGAARATPRWVWAAARLWKVAFREPVEMKLVMYFALLSVFFLLRLRSKALPRCRWDHRLWHRASGACGPWPWKPAWTRRPESSAPAAAAWWGSRPESASPSSLWFGLGSKTANSNKIKPSVSHEMRILHVENSIIMIYILKRQQVYLWPRVITNNVVQSSWGVNLIKKINEWMRTAFTESYK